jgi:molybdopterin/thiamine biosynthesis adenylyltransferase
MRRLRETRVLFIGFDALAAEICKNVVLVGVKSVTLVEPAQITQSFCVSHLFLGEGDAGSQASATL